MIHIKNKKKPLEVTVEEMRKFSLSYLGKYAPSKQQLKTYLLKKYLNKTALNIKKQDITGLIDIVLSDLEKTKFISDKFYSETKAKNLIQRGNSINKIRNYLISKGIDASRLTAKGYGESQLVNDCGCEPTNNSDCTEEQHQLNRRSEFIIVKM